ncbi:MAG: hypothetical protein J7K40_10440 [candidate division Zixibacteria bacterium]|nr:hypothetical protein [candidate division Zixibacteria bacterium]
MKNNTNSISYYVFIFLDIAMISIFIGCSCNGDNPITDYMPEIIDADAPFYITAGTPISYPFYAFVSDPQGLGDIDIVYITIERPDGLFNPDTLFMHDDGLNIDTTENDGVYSYALDEDELTIFEVNGSYLFHFHASDQDGNSAAPVRKMAAVIVQPSPVIISLTAPALMPLGFPDTIDISVIVDDLQGLDDIVSVYFTIEKPDGSLMPDTSYMLDDGQGCDSIAGDGIFSYCLTGIDTSESAGVYIYYFTARDSSGNPGNVIEHTIYMSDVNPHVYNLIAPDSIIRSYDSSYFFISAYDPQGLNNIDQVYYTVTKPDGTSNGIGFLMTDRGDNGDSVAGDGIYVAGFTGPTPENQAGDYIFHFTAIDDQENQANLINHVVTAYDTTSLYIYKHGNNNMKINECEFKQPDTLVEAKDFFRQWQ